MIAINNFEIITDGQQLAIDVETNVGDNISSIILWNKDTFKDYALGYNLTYKLEQVNNKEIFVVDAEELSIAGFEDIYFIEVQSTFIPEDAQCINCQDPALGITYNLAPYYACMVNYILETKNLDCGSCKELGFNDMTITISLLIETIENSLELGYYTQALDLLEKVKKLCSFRECKNCEKVQCASCSKFKQISN